MKLSIIKPIAKKELKKPSELEENKPIVIKEIHVGLDSNSIACFCPYCGIEHEFKNDWPVDIPTVCSEPIEGEEPAKCGCRFIIPDNVEIVEV